MARKFSELLDKLYAKMTTEQRLRHEKKIAEALKALKK